MVHWVFCDPVKYSVIGMIKNFWQIYQKFCKIPQKNHIILNSILTIFSELIDRSVNDLLKNFMFICPTVSKIKQPTKKRKSRKNTSLRYSIRFVFESQYEIKKCYFHWDFGVSESNNSVSIRYSIFHTL